MDYQVTKLFIPDLPKIPYDSGSYVGVIMHSTANYNNDTTQSEINYETKTWQDAFVHFFIDWFGISQCADENFICYGAGHTANHSGYVQQELCQTYDEVNFKKSYDMWIWNAARLLSQKQLVVVDGVTLMSHKQVSLKWHETDHTDPIDYLARHGKSWEDVVNDVTEVYKSMQKVPEPEIEQWEWDAAKFITSMGFFDGLHNPRETMTVAMTGKILMRLVKWIQDYVKACVSK